MYSTFLSKITKCACLSVHLHSGLAGYVYILKPFLYYLYFSRNLVKITREHCSVYDIDLKMRWTLFPNRPAVLEERAGV